MIQHAKRAGEKKLFINNKCYKVDGYYYDRENKMRNVYEFLDVIGMDVQNVIVLKKYVKKIEIKKTMKELYDQTKERLKTIEDYLKPNVKIHTIWECEFDQQKYPEVDPHLKPIDKRDAFYGGRTETIQLYNNLSDLKEIDKAIEKGYKLQKIYELEHFEKTSTDIFKLYVDTFMKYKQEASGCKCDPKYCKPDCENDKECKTKIQYIIDNAAYNLDIDKVKHNSGLRFIAKICLNNLWGHFAHARLKLYELLDILQERVLYMDTDSCIYNDDGSEACKKVENMMGSKLGDLTDEIVSKHNANHIKQFISAGPKDYSMKLDTEKLVSCCKGFRLNAEVEEKITLDKKNKNSY
ncbi:unnamed protein product [Mytilus coruscus]|uniref:DNA-directed DNA polymerase n=2 Tax=Mytilus coruscus TaxID=42192 RepID=A0A6J7ZWT0_MYTCO|nr:unnamed protein product [Mytilus coruscus]